MGCKEIYSLSIKILPHQPLQAPAVVDAFYAGSCCHGVCPVGFSVDGQCHGADGISLADGGVQAGKKVGGADGLFFFRIQKKGGGAGLADVADFSLPVFYRKLPGNAVAQGDGHIFKILHAVIHEFAGILPFIAAVGRPAAAQHYGDEQTVVGFHGTHETVAGVVGETGFDADGAGIRGEESVFVVQRIGLAAGDFLYGVGRFPDDAAEIFIVQSVTGEDGQIVAGGIMIVAVQTIGGLKGSLIAAVGAGFFGHGLTEGLHGTAQMLGNGHGGVIVGLQHEGVEKIR